MAGREHRYTSTVVWTGNRGPGTTDYKAYSRDHVIRTEGKAEIAGSSDPAFRGDAGRHNPEDLLVASLSSCHMLWYLHLAAEAGVVVTGYRDDPVGTMVEDAARGGYFTRVVLKPRVKLAAGSDRALAIRLHEKAHAFCFVANSVNFPVDVEPSIEADAD